MEITGKLIHLLPEVSGEGKNGRWVKQEAVIETQEQYSKKVCISFLKENVEKIQAIPLGSLITISLNIESREYNGRWFTNVIGWKITGNTQAPPMP